MRLPLFLLGRGEEGSKGGVNFMGAIKLCSGVVVDFAFHPQSLRDPCVPRLPTLDAISLRNCSLS